MKIRKKKLWSELAIFKAINSTVESWAFPIFTSPHWNIHDQISLNGSRWLIYNPLVWTHSNKVSTYSLMHTRVFYTKTDRIKLGIFSIQESWSQKTAIGYSIVLPRSKYIIELTPCKSNLLHLPLQILSRWFALVSLDTTAQISTPCACVNLHFHHCE